MKKYNNINYRGVLAWVVIPILIFLLVLNTTYAYFTASTNKKGNLSTGVISVAFTDETTTQVVTDAVEQTATFVQPGQTINISGGVKNTSEHDIYAIIYVTIYVEGMQGYVHSGHYTATGEAVNISNGVSSTPATKISAFQTSNFSIDYTLDFYQFDNSYMGKKIYTSYQAKAIQFAGISTAVEACNLLLNITSSDIPGEFQPVEYLTFTGTQYINTLYKPKSSTKINIDLKATSSQAWIFGSRSAVGGSDSLGLFVETASTNTQDIIHIHRGGNNPPNGGKFTATGTHIRRKISVNETTTICNNEKTLDYSNTITTSTRDMYLGTMNTNNKADYRYFKGNIYEFEILEGDTLMRKFVPCYRKTDKVAGMFDTVTGKFFTNAGTGSFSVGGNTYSINDFQQVEYLESTGTQYIRTDIKTFNMLTDTAEMKAQLMNDKNVLSTPMCGLRQSNGGFGFWYKQNKGYYVLDGTNDRISSVLLPKIATFKYDKGKSYVNNTELATQTQNLTINGNLFLFTICNADGQPDSRYAVARIYNFKFYRNDEIIIDLIPCVRKSDNVAGMYDKVSGRFFTNAGTGEFLVGENLYSIDEFQQVEYLGTSGTQYIDTGYKGSTLSSAYELDFELSNTSKGQGIIGTRNIADRNNSSSMNVFCMNNSTLRMDALEGNSNNSVSVSANTRYNMYVSRGKCILNGVTKTSTVNNVDVAENNNVLVGNMNNNGTAYNPGMSGKIYSCKIYHNGNVVRDLVPCVRKSDNVAGMYDKVTGRFFTNAGTGEFTVGESTYNINQFEQVEYIMSTGTQYIDTDYYADVGSQIDFDLQFVANENTNVANDSNGNAFIGHSNSVNGKGPNYFECNFGAGANECKTIFYWTGLAYNQHDTWCQYYASVTNRSVLHMESGKASFQGVERTTETKTGKNKGTTFLLADYSPSANKIKIFNRYDTKIYSCKIYENGKVVRDLIPCYRKSDNKVGLFDKASGRFFTNAGTGEFVVGDNIYPGYSRDNFVLLKPYITLDNNVFSVDYTNTGTANTWATFMTKPDTSLITPGKTYTYVLEILNWEGNATALHIGDTAPTSNERAQLSYEFENIESGKTYFFTLKGLDLDNYYALSRDFIEVPPGKTAKGSWRVSLFEGEMTKEEFEKRGYTSPSEKSMIPSAFQQVEYLQSTGTQYIDTGLKNSNKNKYITSINWQEKRDSRQLIGNTPVYFGVSASGYYETFTASSIKPSDGFDNIEFTYNADEKVRTLYVNETLACKYTNFTHNTTNILLFNIPDRSYDFSCNCKIKYFKIYDNDTLVRDFVPCVRKSDKVAGMYDKVSGRFFKNAGTGAFTVGANV